jgi:aspartyl-tRNA(Asn)/glutamyl-tRNA(Gln) amidotransferase subunit A
MELGNTADLTIEQLAPLLRRRRLSPVELTRFLIARIERLQPVLNAFITITADAALSQARKAEKAIARGQYLGPLHGIPICLKDNLYTRALRTTAGSKILKAFVPDQNAVVVDRLNAAGSILLGKTNMHEFAYGVTNVNPHYGPVRNPWDPRRISGGSSGGSAAAVTAALSVSSLGTDTGGSIRIPAAVCGCVGFKPTYGLISVSGVVALAPSFDHVGPLCRCVADAATVIDVIAGLKVSRELRKGVKGMRIGIPRQYFFNHIQADVRRCVLAAIDDLEKLGARVCQVDLRGMKETDELAAEITVAEALAVHWKWFRNRAADYGPDLRRRLEASTNQLARTYLSAQKKRKAYSERWMQSFDRLDAFAMPTLPVVAPRLGDLSINLRSHREDVRHALLRLTRPGNLTGAPAISIPCGFSREGLPVGLQLVGREWGEATLLRISYAYEQSTQWHKQWPAL